MLATLRYNVLWPETVAGSILTGLLAGLILFTALVAWFSRAPSSTPRPRITRANWITAICIFGAFIVLMALYPQNWRQGNIAGALLTALVGLIGFFLTVWTWARLVVPDRGSVPFEDSIDDVAAIYHWWRSHLTLLKLLFMGLAKVRAWPLARWLNPRRHPWNSVILLGIVMGLSLALAEVTGEGGIVPHQESRLLIITAIFVSFECLGIVLSYALLAQPLGLFR